MENSLSRRQYMLKGPETKEIQGGTGPESYPPKCKGTVLQYEAVKESWNQIIKGSEERGKPY